MEHNFIPVQEDTAEYRVFLPGASATELEALADDALIFLRQNFIKDYIWQDESFNLRLFSQVGHRLRPIEPPGPKSGDASATPNHLVGQTRFGDNLDDEWFITYLLFELSKQFPKTFIRYENVNFSPC